MGEVMQITRKTKLKDDPKYKELQDKIQTFQSASSVFNPPKQALTKAEVDTEMKAQRAELKSALFKLGIKVNSDFKMEGVTDAKAKLNEITEKMGGKITPDLAKLWIINTMHKDVNEKVIKAEINGIEFIMNDNHSNIPAMIDTTNGKLWQTNYNAIKAVGGSAIKINHVNYKDQFIPGVTHGSGSAFDIGGIIVKGKFIPAYIMNGENMEYPKELKAFDNAFMNQPGTNKVWTPYIMYGGPGSQVRDNDAWLWLKSKPNDIYSVSAFEKFLEERQKILNVNMDWGHRDHNHYDINLEYVNYRNWE